MPTYSDWLNSTRTLYANAITNAYNNRNTSGNDWYLAWQTMSATSDLAGILPPGSAAFWNTGGPNATEANILTLQTWLQNNPVTAGQLSLEPTLTHRDDGRSSLGNAGNVGTEKRRWKGQPLYTFANGVLVGKGGNIAAAIGTEGGADLDGFGTDTISYFDGIPFATGTGVPGTTVFRGDTVISGSIKGTGGVVIIPDVIQLEQDSSITNPAGIGVDKDGKIRLRHRGEGFKDLVQEISTAETNATNTTKLWAATQNTSSGRWGNSLIANSNFSYKDVDSSTYAERFANIISVGTTSNILSEPTSGVARFTGTAGGICFQAIPVNSDRYAIRIRFEGSVVENADNDAAPEGLYVAFHETSDEDLGDNMYVYDNLTPGSTYEGSSVHTSNVTVKFPKDSTTEDSGTNIDGITVAASMTVHSFTYFPTSTAKNASLVIYTKNYTGTIDIDYVVLTEAPRTSSEINGLITDATADITAESEESLVPDAQGTDKTKWAARGTGVTIDNDTDRLSSGGDPAIKLSTPTAGGSIVSSRIACETDRYVVGAKVRVLSSVGGNPTISMFAIQDPNQSYPTIGAALTTPLTHPSGSNSIKNISIVEVNSSGAAIGNASAGVSIATDSNFHTLVGTYEVTVTYRDSDGTEYSTYDASRTPHPSTPIQLPGSFSLAVQADRECVLLVDYVYARIQGASVNIAEGLANQAYTDSHSFVTAMNQLVIKESGSIITNSSMAILDNNGKPSGWRTTTDCTLTFDNTGDYAIQITRSGSGTRRLVTPTFSLGTADKFSVGVRIKGVSGGITPVVKVALSSDSLVPTGFVTIAQTNGGKSDVYTTNTSETSALTIAPTTTTGTNYATVLATWNRSSTQQNFVGGMASLIIESAGDFIVDYVFVKEQTVSYNLADAQAESRRDEAIAQSEGYLTGLSETMVQESGSLMSNAGFGSWYLTNGTTGNQRPQGWYTTRNNSSSPLRVIAASEGTNSTGETVENVNQIGSALKFSPGASGGMLSPKFDLPISPAFGSEIDSSQEASGKYTLAIRVRLGSAEPVGIRLYAHEYYKFTDTVQTHVLCTDHTYGTTTYESTTKIKAFTTSVENGAVSRIKLINFTEADTVVGYGSDEYIEYIPVDNSETQGDTDGVASNYATWYQVGGTYSPNASTKQVSFEVVIVGDPDSDSTYPNVYIDYVNLVAQPFDADFAQSLADSRITTNIGTFSGSGAYNGMNIAQALNLSITSLQQVESDLADEIASSSIIPDSFFQDNTGGKSNTWMPTRSTDGTVDVSTTGSYGQTGTYAKLADTDDNNLGMLSKYISRGDLFATGTNPFFNVVVRLRDQTDSSGEEYSVIVIAHEWFSGTAPSNNWVYANGGSFSLSDESSTVSRYNTGAGGATQTLNGIGATLIGSGTADGEVELAQGDASWKTVAFEYQANTNTKYVSFEIVINEDYDSDGDAIVLIDGVLLQQATDQTLVNTLADTQILATDFTSGGTLYSQNSGFASTLDGLSTATGDIVNIETNLGTVATSIGNLTAAANETALVNEQIASEVATLIGNGGFSDGLTDKKHIPLGFIPHLHTCNFIRYLDSSDTTLSVTDAYNPSNGGQTSTTYNWDLVSVVNGHGANTGGYTTISNAPYYNSVGGNGFGVAFGVKEDATIWDTQDGMAGFYTKALSLPNLETQTHTVTTTHSSTATSATTTEGARYTIAFRVKPLKQNQEFAIVAHEYDTDLSPSTSGGYIKATTGTNPSTPTGGSYTTNMTYAFGEKHGGYLSALGMQAFTATRNIILDVLKLSDSGDASRQAFESCTADTWNTVGGTYTATGTAKCVSFSLLVRTNPTSSTTTNWTSTLSGLNTTHASHSGGDGAFITTLCDFAYMEPQLMNADMVENIAALRAADVQNTLDDSLTTLEGNLGAESDSLMPNGNFAQKFTDSVDYVKSWIPTGSGSANRLALQAADSGSKSIGTYVKFNKTASGGSSPYGDNISGILSKAISNPVEIVRDLEGNINAFNIGMRIRGTVADDVSGTTSYSPQITTASYITNTSNGGTSSSTSAAIGMIASPAAISINNEGSGPSNFSFSLGNYASFQNSNNTIWRMNGTSSASNGVLSYRIASSDVPANSKYFVVYIGVYTVGADSSRAIELTLTAAANYNAYYTNDAGSSWTQVRDRWTGSTFTKLYAEIDNNLAQGVGRNMVAFVCKLASTLDGNSTYDIEFRGSGDASDYTYLTDAIGYQFAQETSTTTYDVPDFAVKLIAHESYEAISDPNVFIRGSAVSAVSPHTQVGPSLSAAFSSGASTAQNLIDLRYSQSTDGNTQSDSGWITIDASVQDSGEYITDWRHIVGSYTPNEATTAVSFEILIDHEKDGDATIQEVWLDSVTMAVSSVGTDLASTIADNRVFVEQAFLGGSTPVSPNNVIKNADFAQSILVSSSFSQGASDDLKRPMNWYYMTDDSTWTWASTDFIFSPDNTATNRAIQFTNKSNGKSGIISSPFRITSDKYKVRITLKGSTGSMEGSLHAFCSNQTLQNADAIFPTGNPNDGDYLWPNDGAQVAANGSYFKRQEWKLDGVSFGTSIVVREYEWTPQISSSTQRPGFSDLPQFASLVFQGGGESSDTTITVHEFSAEPIGKAYGSFDGFYGGTAIYGSGFDNERDLLPDAPRDIVQAYAQINTIDIEVTDTTSASSAKNRLLLAAPRKWYDSNSGSTAQGTSYLYPGVSDLEYREDASVGNGYRTLSFPTTTTNRIYNVEQMRFTNKDDPKLRWEFKVVERTENSSTPSLTLDLAPKLMANHATYGNTNSTTTSILGRSGGFMKYRFGMFSQNVREPRNSDPNFSEEGSTDTRDTGLQLYGYNIKTAYTSWNNTHSDHQHLNTYVDCHWSQTIDAYLNTSDYVYTSLHFSWDIKPTGSQLGVGGTSEALGSESNEVGYITSASDQGYLSFTGQHRSVPDAEKITKEHIGLIVVASGKYRNLPIGSARRVEHQKTEEELSKPAINESLPMIKLSTKRNQKSCFGIVSDCEDTNDTRRTYEQGCWVSSFYKDKGDDRIYVNSLGEGAVWICNINGNLENGDYITTCEIPGYGMLQDDGLLHNYTVAKITQDCDFELDNPYYDCVEFEFEGQAYRKAFVGCTYHCG